MPVSATGIKLGKAFVIIEALDRTGPLLNKIGKKFELWGRKLQQLGQKVLAGGILANIPAALSVREFMRFDDVMRSVGAKLGATESDLAMLSATARELGLNTRYTATEVAKLMETLAQRGFNPGQIKNMSKAILDLAAATGEGGETDADLAASLVSGLLLAFQKDASETTQVANLLTIAINESNSSLGDMADSLSYAAPAAAEYNMSLEETLALTGLLRDLNIEATTVGTAIRNMMLQMSQASGRNEFNKMLKEMTGNTIDFVDEAGNLRSPTDLLFAMGQAMEKVGSAQKGDLLQKMFGLRALMPASVIGKSLDKFERLMARLQEGADTDAASTQAKQREAGIGGALRRMRNNILDLAISFGSVLAPALQGFATQLTKNIQNINVWVQQNKEAVIQIALLIAAVPALGIALIGLGLSFKLAGSMIVLAGSAVSIFSKVLYTGLAVTKLFAVMLMNMAAGLVTLARMTVIAGVALVRLIAMSIVYAATVITKAVAATLYWSSAITVELLTSLLSLLGMLPMVAVQLLSLAGLIMAQVVWSFYALATSIGVFLAELVVAASASLPILIALGVAAIVVVGIFEAVSSAASKMKDDMASLGNNLSRIFSGIGSFISSALGTIWEEGSTLVTRLVSVFTVGFGAIFRTVKDTMGGVVTALTLGDTEAAWRIAILGLEASWLQLKHTVLGIWDEVRLSFAKMIAEMKAELYGIADALKDTVPGAFLKSKLDEMELEKQLEAEREQLRARGLLPPDAKAEQQNKAVAALKVQLDKEAQVRLNALNKLRAALDEELALLNKRKEVKQAEDRFNEFDKALKDFEALRREGIGKLIKPGQANVETQKALDGLVKGTVQAAKKAYENQFRDLKKEAFGPEQEQVALLEDINDKLENLQTVGMV